MRVTILMESGERGSQTSQSEDRGDQSWQNSGEQSGDESLQESDNDEVLVKEDNKIR